MHERSIMKDILMQVDQLRENTNDIVTEIRVEVGPLAGVEPMLLVTAFEQLAGEVMSQAKFIVEEVPLTARCENCDFGFEVANYDFRCRVCGGNVIVTSGDELLITSVTLNDVAPVES